MKLKYSKRIRQSSRKYINNEFIDFWNTDGLLCEIQDWFEYQPEWIKIGSNWIMI